MSASSPDVSTVAAAMACARAMARDLVVFGWQWEIVRDVLESEYATATTPKDRVHELSFAASPRFLSMLCATLVLARSRERSRSCIIYVSSPGQRAAKRVLVGVECALASVRAFDDNPVLVRTDETLQTRRFSVIARPSKTAMRDFDVCDDIIMLAPASERHDADDDLAIIAPVLTRPDMTLLILNEEEQQQ